MKRAHVHVLLLVLASNYATLAHAVDVTKSEEGVVTVAFKDNDLVSVSQTLTKAFGVRVCSEDYGVVNPESKTVIPGDFESGGPIAKGSEYRFSGEFTAMAIDDVLDALTGSSPYTWQVSNDCYVIYPRKGSLLMTEKVTLDIPPCSLIVATLVIHSQTGRTHVGWSESSVWLGEGRGEGLQCIVASTFPQSRKLPNAAFSPTRFFRREWTRGVNPWL